MNNTDVIILCGGSGSRLKTVVSDRPKSMAEVNGKPFLSILIEQVSLYGFGRVILCSGYKAGYIRNYFSAGLNKDIELVFSEETEMLGTAGALRNAEALIRTENVLVKNGDSFCNVNLKSFLEFHKINDADLSVVLTEMQGTLDVGSVQIDRFGKMLSFNEKTGSGTSLVNAGIYLFKANTLKEIPPSVRASLEYDLFPRLVGMGRAYGFVTKEPMIDIGTPERYIKASSFFK